MDNENMVQEPKKKSPIVLVIILIIIAFGCIAGGYYLNESGILGNKNTNTQESGKGTSGSNYEPVVTNYEVTDEKVANLIDNLLKGSFQYGGCKGLEVFANDKKVEAKDLSSLVIYHIVEMNEYFDKAESFTLDEFNAAAKKYFDSSYKFDATSIDYKGSSCPQFNYDSNTKTFTKQQTACGGTCGPVPTYKLIKAVDTDGVLVLDTKVVFAATDKESVYFSDYQKTNALGDSDSDPKELLDKGSEYKFTFKLVDGNYVFVSSEPEE